MKILFYINVLSGGGAERVVANLATYLSNKNDVIIINSFQTENEYEVSDNVQRLYIDNNNYKSRLKKNYVRIKFLKNYIKREKPDVCISFMAEPNFRLILAANKLKTKTIISVRNDPDREYGGFINGFLAKHLLVRADGCVFQTNDAKLWFPKNLQEKSTIILNPINTIFFGKLYTGRRENIVTCGRLNSQKNHSFLIDAFNKIKDEVSDDLIIYGEGNLRTTLEQQIKNLNLENRVKLMGNVSNVQEVIKTAKCFVLSSNFEGMPNALMEAMTLGIPCVSTDCPCGGPKTLISNEVDGVLVSINDKESLANAIKKICLDNSFADTIGHNAYIKAKQSFKKEIIYNQWEKYLNKIGEG